MNRYILLSVLLLIVASANLVFWVHMSQKQQQLASSAQTRLAQSNATEPPVYRYAVTTPPRPAKEGPTPSPAPTAKPANKTVAKTYGTPAQGTTSTTTSGSGLPKKISIPKIGLTTSFEYVGLDSSGRMDVPKSFRTVGWYNLGAKPGDTGSAVVSGHYDTVTGAPAVFYNISKLAPGDRITVTNDRNETLTFQVTGVEKFPYDQLPLQRIFAQTSSPELNLITCGGTWDNGSRNYSDRWVVYSQKI